MRSKTRCRSTAVGASIASILLIGAAAHAQTRTSAPPALGAWPALVRVRVILTTESAAADLALETGTIINAAVLSGGRPARVQLDGNHLSFNNDAGGPAETRVGLLISGIRARAPVRWHLTLRSAAAPTKVEVYNENQQGRSRRVDRFDANTEESILQSPADLLLSGEPLSLGVGPRPLVLAFFYPWWQHFSWSSPELLDRPLFSYSTEIPGDIAHALGDVRAAGLDGVIVSWRGDTDWNDRRLRIVLDEAQKRGLTVSILVETLLAADKQPDGTKRLAAEKIGLWLEKAFDAFTSHPAFLRMGGRPVIFVYATHALTVEEWGTIVQSLKGRGRDAFLMADALNPALLESFSGAFTYSNILRPDLAGFDADQALRTESYHLLLGGERRVDAAAVSPGYDDGHLPGRETAVVSDRANGAVYNAQWQAAVAAHPDWILVTSWNEFWENTHIEPSVRFGRQYQGLTLFWTRLFRNAFRHPPGP